MTKRNPTTGRQAFRPIYRAPPPDSHASLDAQAFNDALARLELPTQQAAAQVLGIGRRSVIRYATGQQEVPTVVMRLLEQLIQHGIPKEYAA